MKPTGAERDLQLCQIREDWPTPHHLPQRQIYLHYNRVEREPCPPRPHLSGGRQLQNHRGGPAILGQPLRKPFHFLIHPQILPAR